MRICLADKKDAVHIARIHLREINQGFLSQLGLKFLSKLYEAMILSKNSFVVIAKENNQIIGFISGSVNARKFYKYFFKKYFFQIFFILLLKITNFKKIFETLKYSQENQDLPQAELLSIAVVKKYQGRGVAQKLFEKFFKEMQKLKVKKFKVVVSENLTSAIGFYAKMGFKYHSSVSIHQNKLSKIYIYG